MVFYYPTPSPHSLVLITGATGHVGSTTLLHLLRAGYSVRAAVRSDAKIAQVLSRPSIQALNLPRGRLTFCVVPDITITGAYDDAVEGATHVIHIASPLVTGDESETQRARHEEFFVRPAVRGTIGMLESALHSGTVRRVVITSSITSIVPVPEMEGTTSPRAKHLPAVSPDDRMPPVSKPYTSEFAAYAASKVAALAATEKWLEENRPPFEVVHLHPSFVLGRNDSINTTAQCLRGTNAIVLASLLGKRFGPYAGATVHVDDVARAHVAALSPRIPGNQSYILSDPRGARWNDAKEIAARNFPEAIKSRLFGSRGDVSTVPLRVDATLTEETFGFRFRPFEEQVTSLVAQFLDLRMQQRLLAATTAATAIPTPRAIYSTSGIHSLESILQVRANA